jgi:hypothetical protein
LGECDFHGAYGRVAEEEGQRAKGAGGPGPEGRSLNDQ